MEKVRVYRKVIIIFVLAERNAERQHALPHNNRIRLGK